MDLEGIAALAAAGVAAVGISAALLVGRWQLHGALATAEEAARAGIAQAEANYRAALDAVRASATEAHAQWRRGVRREAYSAFLLSCQQVTEASDLMREECARRGIFDQLEMRRTEVSAATTKLRSTALVVTLEGPEGVAGIANAMVDTAIRVAQVDETIATLKKARHELEELCNDRSAEWNGALNAFHDVLVEYERFALGDPNRGRYFGIPGENIPSEMEELVHRLSEARSWVPYCHYSLAWQNVELARNGDGEANSEKAAKLSELSAMQTEYVTKVRSVLDKTQ